MKPIHIFDSMGNGELQIGDKICVQARVRLGNLAPDEVAVEFYLGRSEC